MKKKEIPIQKAALHRIYENAGREPGLKKILKDFYGRMSKDAMIGFFFFGKNTDEIAEKQLSFLLRAMGITPSYTGKAPAQAHDDLPEIRRGQFDRRLVILEETLRAHGLSDEDIRTWVAFENAFRDAILGD